MRILAVTTPLPTAERPGTMAPTARQIDSLRALGVQVDVLEVKGVAILKYLQAIPQQRALLSPVDLIHAHYGYCGWLARNQFKKPVVVSFMGDDLLGTPDDNGKLQSCSRVMVRANRQLARLVGAVIVKSAEMAEVVAPTHAHVVPNGVDMDQFRPMQRAEARTLLGWDDDRRYILFAGDPSTPRKGFRLAHEAVTRASSRLAESLSLVPLTGVAPDRVPLYMNGCDFMLMTSFIEGSPNVVKEALACNLPVVSVPVGDVPELLVDVGGCAVCPRDAEALAEAITRRLGSRPSCEGRATLKSKGLDLGSVAQNILDIYQSVLAR